MAKVLNVWHEYQWRYADKYQIMREKEIIFIV